MRARKITNLHGLSIERSCHATCGSQNDPGERVAIQSHAIFAGSSRAVRVARSSRTPQQQTVLAPRRIAVRYGTVNSDGKLGRRKTARYWHYAVRGGLTALRGSARSRARYVRSAPSWQRSAGRGQIGRAASTE